MHGIAEHAFDGVRAKERKNRRALDVFEASVLLGGTEDTEAAESLQAGPVDFTRRFPALPAKFRGAGFKRRLRVAIVVAPVGRGELAVDVDDDTGFVGPGPDSSLGKMRAAAARMVRASSSAKKRRGTLMVPDWASRRAGVRSRA
jgi:hypothetical protein